MANVDDAKTYLKKLQRIINMDNEFSLFGNSYIKKTKVDDVLCCFISSLPEAFKKEVQFPKKTIPKSIQAYKVLMEVIHIEFKLNKNLYSINLKECDSLINTIISTLEADLNHINAD